MLPAVVNAVMESMVSYPGVVGVVLAGGQSRRMGRDKALLNFRGKVLLLHMMDTLYSLGLKDVFVSGSFPGYPCIEDSLPHTGPVQGIKSVLRYKSGYKGYLFVPVDMPLLPARALKGLLSQEQGGYYTGWPLPAYITPPFFPSSRNSVRGFLSEQGIYPVSLPNDCDDFMKNANTPKEWDEVESYEC